MCEGKILQEISGENFSIQKMKTKIQHTYNFFFGCFRLFSFFFVFVSRSWTWWYVCFFFLVFSAVLILVPRLEGEIWYPFNYPNRKVESCKG